MAAIVGIDASILFVSTSTLAAVTTGYLVEVTTTADGAAMQNYVTGDAITLATTGGGTGGIIKVTASGGDVTATTISTDGAGYAVGDVLTQDSTDGSGSGWTGVVAKIDSSLTVPTWNSGSQTWTLGVNNAINADVTGAAAYSWTEFTERNEISISISVDVAEHKVFVTNIEHAWVEKARLYMDWSGSMTGYYDDATDEIFDTMKEGMNIWLYIVPTKLTPAKYWAGKVILTSVDHTIANEDFASLDVDFEGNGPLYRSDIPVA